MSSLSVHYDSSLDAAVIAEGPAVRPVPATSTNIIVVPAYNEAENIPRLLSDLESRLQLFRRGGRLIVVDDGSEDGTAELLGAYDGPVPLQLVCLGENQGPGAAFRAGFAAALHDCPEDALVVTLEADNTSDLDALPEMIECARGGADLVLASVHGGGRMVNVSLVRRVLSRGAGLIVRHALGLDAHTVSSFFRVYRASALRAAQKRYGDAFIREPGFACKAEILAKLSSLGVKIEEVPVDLDASNRIGDSKMPVLQTLAGYWRLMTADRLEKESSPA